MYPKGAVALVTGAATGIGYATAEAFAKAGCNLILANRNAERGQVAAKKLGELGVQAHFIATDVSDAEQVTALHQQAMERFGRVDVACNDAGIEGALAPTADCSVENFDQTIAINLRGVFLCMREQLRIMVKQGHGAIVNVSSVAGLVGFNNLPAYCASKGGVIQLTRTAALEYAEQGIRVNAVCPGAIHTDMIDRITGKDAQTEAQFAALQPMNRMGKAEEVAAAIVWLGSSQASFVTGHPLAVDGGFVAR